MPDAGVLATVLLVLGLFLLSLELMVPSFGLIGLSALICLMISGWSAWQAWGANGKDWTFFLVYVGFLGFGVPGVFFLTFYLIQNTSLGGLVVLRSPSHESGSAGPQIRVQLQELVGKTGVAASPLTPGGMVQIDGERHHAETTGPLIESGTPVRVIDTRGTRLLVLAHTVTEQESTERVKPAIVESANPDDRVSSSERQLNRTSEESDLLDFDVPENYTAN